jgi:hypothetical protein
MLATAQIEETAGSTTPTPAKPTQVVDVENWLDRAKEPTRPFTPSICEYVPRHRAEAPRELT